MIAALVATGARYGVVRLLMHGPHWIFLPAPLVETVLGAVGLLVVAGQWGTRAALRAKAAPWLRNEWPRSSLLRRQPMC